MNRLEANKRILKYLEECIEKYPEQRFGQILQNYAFIRPHRPAKENNMIDWKNEFYMESDELLKRVKQRIEDMEEK